jgi:O-antigen/teichoic acid export membrane protein
LAPVRMSEPHRDAPDVAPPQDALGAEAVDPMQLDRPVGDLRGRTARGTLINSGFQIGLSGLGALQRVVVAAFLTRTEFGLWAVVLVILVNLSWLKDLGIGDKYLQQSEPDQERAFQKAFTLELIVSCAFLVLVVLVLPLWALAYGHESIILPGVLTALTVPLTVFEMPAMVPYRRLDYKRNRILTSVDPVVTFVVTVALAVAGAGYWCFVFGLLAGTIAGGIVCTLTSPYPLALRFDRGTFREYASFSWPLVGAGLSRLLVVQGSLIVANHVVGLAGVGAIGLATGIATFADRVDAIVGQTIYPAVCAVARRTELLAEVFVKSNRIALMWAMPFASAAALFAADLVHYVLGERWRPAVGLIIAISLTCGIGQVAFNWGVFLRAVNKTRPIFVSSVFNLVTYLGVAIPGILLFGLAGYAAAFTVSTIVQIGIRGYYMSRFFRGFNVLRQMARGLAPAVPPALIVLGIRALAPGPRTLGQVIVELVAFVVSAVGFTYVLERRLIVEMAGYLRGRGRPSLTDVAPGAAH